MITSRFPLSSDWLFQDFDDFDHVLYLWRNDQTVVVGRSQNPWLECDLNAMRRDHIYLARRQSGGGAVFQDMGNTNFTLISKKDLYDKKANTQIILNALKQFKIVASASGRNDIVVQLDDGARKISGSAYKEKMDRAFHHGTLLINTNPPKLVSLVIDLSSTWTGGSTMLGSLLGIKYSTLLPL